MLCYVSPSLECCILTCNYTAFEAMLHEAIFLATCNATMANKKPFKLQRGCNTAICLATLQKVEGHSTFPVTRDATIAVAKWGVKLEFFLVCCVASCKKIYLV